MKREFIPILFAAILLFGCQNQEKTDSEQNNIVAPAIQVEFPGAFLDGSYELIGRYPDTDSVYAGSMSISLDESKAGEFSVTRTVSGKTISGVGRMAETSSDQVNVFRVAFVDDGTDFEATYLISSDLDNYARLTGYLYQNDGSTVLPGIEALFSDHYKTD